MELQKTCFLYGSKCLRKEEKDYLERRMLEDIKTFITMGFCRFVSCGERGFDLLSCGVVLYLKQQFPQVHLTLLLSHPAQGENWRKADREALSQAAGQADKVCTFLPAYERKVQKNRLQLAAELSDVCFTNMVPIPGQAPFFDEKKQLRIPVYCFEKTQGLL